MVSHQTRHGIGTDAPHIFKDKVSQSQKHINGEERIARGLGWLSIGLGVAELVTPKTLGKMIGVRNHRTTMRMLGLREITSGIGIFSRRRPADWIWSRVAGDFMDLALLGGAFASSKSKRRRVAAATAAVAGVTALDIITARKLSSVTGYPGKSDTIFVTKTITVNKSPEHLYQFWRNFENLPHFMKNLEAVRVTGEKSSHWIASGPADTRVEWDAEIVNDVPNQMIAWRSKEGSDVQNSGSVQFIKAPAGRGTRILIELKYKPPGGSFGATFAKVFGKEPGQQAQEELRRFKQVMETGEIATTEGQPSGKRGFFTNILQQNIDN